MGNNYRLLIHPIYGANPFWKFTNIQVYADLIVNLK